MPSGGAGEVVDPHHAIRVGGITYAVVRCTEACPPSHFLRRATSGVAATDDGTPIGPDSSTSEGVRK